MSNLTNLEQIFLNEIKEEAYGGTLFSGDINPKGITKAQKSGVVSSLNKKGIINTEDEDGMIALAPPEGGSWLFDAEYEISKEAVEALIARFQ